MKTGLLRVSLHLCVHQQFYDLKTNNNNGLCIFFFITAASRIKFLDCNYGAKFKFLIGNVSKTVSDCKFKMVKCKTHFRCNLKVNIQYNYSAIYSFCSSFYLNRIKNTHVFPCTNLKIFAFNIVGVQHVHLNCLIIPMQD